jgi:TolA-binding protein
VGNVLFDMAKYDDAEKHWLRALDLFMKENETHPVTNAARLKLGMIKSQRQDYDEAM